MQFFIFYSASIDIEAFLAYKVDQSLVHNNIIQ